MGGISPQQWSRLLKEHTIPTKVDDRGVPRYDADIIEALRDKLGFSLSEDPRDRAIASLHEENESLRRYVKELNDHSLKVTHLLRDENDNIRKMRGEEQAQHLKALIATQEALDLTQERNIDRIKTEAQALRLNAVVDQIAAPAGKLLIAQFSQTLSKSKKVLPELPQATVTGDWRERLKGGAL